MDAQEARSLGHRESGVDRPGGKGAWQGLLV
jgi:hypothetical protein